jgi:hypothetical protein
MLSPYIYAALAHERHQTFLAQAQTDRRARQARLHRQQAGIPGARRSPLRRRPAWLRPDRLWSYDTYSGWVQPAAGAADMGGVACSGPGAEGVGE